MNSLRSKIIIGLIKNRHLFKLKLHREIVDESFDVASFRKRVENASKHSKIEDDIQITPMELDKIYGEWIKLKNSDPSKVLLYIHGGGFISGSCNTHRSHVIKFVKEAGINAFLFNYRLAPEHPFPSALDDCMTVYKWLLDEGYLAKNIVIMGESAGGTLTLSTLLKIKEVNLPNPCCAVSMSPVTDLRCNADSFIRNARKDIATLNSWNVWQKYYAGSHDITDPILSPLLGNLDGLPPIFLSIGTYEVHYDDTINFHQKLIKSGGNSTLQEVEGMVHAFPIMAPFFPEATKAVKEICSYINSLINTEV